jgi:hypothetical protein
MIHCLHCGAETSNGLALCDLCRRKVTTDLDYLPAYFRNLSRWRPGRAGSRQVPGSRVLYEGVRDPDRTSDRIGDALDEALVALTTWARMLSDTRGPFAQPLTLVNAVLSDDLPTETADALNDDQPALVRLLCAGLDFHLTSIATTDWCGELLRDLSQHEERLRGLTEASIPGWYAGACRRCAVSTYVVPGLSWVTCTGCGATTYARDHLETILDEARGWVAPPMRLSEALVALLDTELSVPRLYERIKKWGQRDRIETVRRMDADGDPTGPKRHRFGQVLDVLLTEGATHLDAVAVNRAS